MILLKKGVRCSCKTKLTGTPTFMDSNNFRLIHIPKYPHRSIGARTTDLELGLLDFTDFFVYISTIFSQFRHVLVIWRQSSRIEGSRN